MADFRHNSGHYGHTVLLSHQSLVSYRRKYIHSSEKGNISDQNCRENRNAYFTFSKFSSKIMPFIGQSGKI